MKDIGSIAKLLAGREVAQPSLTTIVLLSSLLLHAPPPMGKSHALLYINNDAVVVPLEITTGNISCAADMLVDLYSP